jgi:hypothetical protein
MAATREVVNSYESTDALEAPAFTDDLSKDEMIEHLMEYHTGNKYINVAGKQVAPHGTKATKAELMAYHERLHADQDDTYRAELTLHGSSHKIEKGQYVRDEQGRPVIEYRFLLGGHPLPSIRHTHAAPVIPASLRAAAGAVRNNQRAAGEGVLSVQDRKVLTQLVDNDFNALKQEMRAFAADSLSARQQEINADWDAKEKAIPDYATDATDLHRKHEDEKAALRAKYEEDRRKMQAKHEDAFKKITDKAEGKGVTLTPEQKTVQEVGEGGVTRNVTRTVYVAKVQGRKDALEGAAKENKTFLDRALLDLEKQRLTAQRQVLLSGVPKDAMPIVESIPDAKTLMVRAQEEKAAREIESKTTS